MLYCYEYDLIVQEVLFRKSNLLIRGARPLVRPPPLAQQAFVRWDVTPSVRHVPASTK
jgi:hypothetical protein